MRSFLFLVAIIAWIPSRAADQPVPVQDDPMHKVVFENDYVRVIDVQIRPGETTLYHIHVIPSVIVYLTQSTNRSESWPDKAILTRDIAPGQSRFAPYDEKPLTHRVTNTGAGLFRVLDIELLKKPSAGGSLLALPSPQIKPHWDEKLARSSTLQIASGAELVLPASRCASLVVGIKGEVQIKSEGPKPTAAQPLKWGNYQFFPPQTRLQVANTGGSPSEMVLLELKG